MVPFKVIVDFIDQHKDELGVEPIIRALQGTHAQIAVSSYYAFKKRPPSARSMRDEQLLPKLRAVYEENYSCYGVRKMWHAMNDQHAEAFGPIARCTVERLMKNLGIDGVRRKRKKPKTRSADPESCPVDWWTGGSLLQRPTGFGWLI
ncbi:IS3 family transposase [Glutamicibacter nicotianae]|uniref:IS3 family transposase n=1 Tax=Glutamicibacter nicotianae TaxID=37929 RepID=UPI00195EBF05|nr:hypothetical protein [Glutamicibacter nicotianae]